MNKYHINVNISGKIIKGVWGKKKETKRYLKNGLSARIFAFCS